MSSKNSEIDVHLSEDENSCVVCSESVRIYSIGACDHPICFLCATRLRVICRYYDCPICRQDMEIVVFCTDIQPFEKFKDILHNADQKYGVCFQNNDIEHEYKQLLVHKCKFCKNIEAFKIFAHLSDHMRVEHALFYCDLCVCNLRLFTWELKFYNANKLVEHEQIGDPGDTAYKGHPLCDFCDKRLFDLFNLHKHFYANHHYCRLCNTDGIYMYYSTINCIKNHIRKSHYVCDEGKCANSLYKCYRTVQDLRSHQKRRHGINFSEITNEQTRTLQPEPTLASRMNSGEFSDHREGTTPAGGAETPVTFQDIPDVSGAEVSNSSQKENCEFYAIQFIDNKEYLRHFHEKHIFCQICSDDGMHSNFPSTQCLKQHLKDCHVICDVGECTNTLFSPSFKNKFDFHLHQAAVHGIYINETTNTEVSTAELEFLLRLTKESNKLNKKCTKSADCQETYVTSQDVPCLSGVAGTSTSINLMTPNDNVAISHLDKEQRIHARNNENLLALSVNFSTDSTNSGNLFDQLLSNVSRHLNYLQNWTSTSSTPTTACPTRLDSLMPVPCADPASQCSDPPNRIVSTVAPIPVLPVRSTLHTSSTDNNSKMSTNIIVPSTNSLETETASSIQTTSIFSEEIEKDLDNLSLTDDIKEKETNVKEKSDSN